MGDHLQAHRPASIEKIALPDKKALFHAGAPSPGHHHHYHGGASSSSHEAPAASITTPRTAAAKQLHLPGSRPPRVPLLADRPRGLFPVLAPSRHRRRRGGSGLHEMSKKPGGV